jgi:hypothetical protein
LQHACIEWNISGKWPIVPTKSDFQVGSERKLHAQARHRIAPLYRRRPYVVCSSSSVALAKRAADASRTVFSTTENMLFVAKKMLSEAESIFYASETGFSITEKTVGEMPAAFA